MAVSFSKAARDAMAAALKAEISAKYQAQYIEQAQADMAVEIFKDPKSTAFEPAPPIVPDPETADFLRRIMPPLALPASE